MKVIRFILWLFVCLSIFLICWIAVNASNFIGNVNSIKGSGNVVTEERPVAAFTHMHVSNGINVFIEAGKADRLKVCADDNLLQYVQTEVSDNTLTVKLQEGVNIRNRVKLDVYVQMEQIESLKTSSGADIKGMALFTVGDIKIRATSAGDIDMELSARHIQVSVSSGSDICLKGKAEVLEGTVTSGADLLASGLNARSCDISVSSGSDAFVNVSETLSYSVSSGADLKCKGQPRVLKSYVGSGGDVKFN